jgi:hypothetical protein
VHQQEDIWDIPLLLSLLLKLLQPFKLNPSKSVELSQH